jgi:hypothetical protein
MKKKKVVFYEYENNYANFKIRLSYDKIKQNEFFCFLIDYYINNEANMLGMVEKYKVENQRMGAKRIAATAQDQQKSNSLLEKVGVTETDRRAIFDMIEEEIGEL